MEFKLLTYNLHLFPQIVQIPASFRGETAVYKDKKRRDEICKRLLLTDPDVIGLTEVWDRHSSKRIIQKLESKYPYVHFPDLDAKLLSGKLLGCGLLLLSKYPIECGFTPFSTLSGDDKLAQKGFISGTITITPNLKIGIFLTHIQAGYKDHPYTKTRIRNVRQLSQAMGLYKKNHGGNMFLLGDMNIADDSSEYKKLLAHITKLGLEDSGKSYPQPTVGKGNTLQLIFSQPYTARIDYIFGPKGKSIGCYTRPKHLSDNILQESFVDRYTYKKEDLSDHYPVLSKFTLEYKHIDTIELKIIRAKHLPRMDLLSRSDPYLKVTMGEQILETKYQKNTSSPIWNTQIDLYAPFSQLQFSVWDHNLVNDSLIGQAAIDLSELNPVREFSYPIRLELKNWSREGREEGREEGDRGELYIELTSNFGPFMNQLTGDEIIVGDIMEKKKIKPKHLAKLDELNLPPNFVYYPSEPKITEQWDNTNWKPSIEQHPLAIYDVKNLSDCVGVIKKAREKKTRVRAVGSGHSYSSVLHAPDFLVTTHELNKVIKSPYKVGNTWEIEAEGGMTVHHLIKKVLKPKQLAIANLGGYDGQTLAGVFSTGTHGSGRSIGPLADIVKSIVLVNHKGEVVRIEPTGRKFKHRDEIIDGYPVRLIQDDNLFHSVTIGWGCFGIIYSLTLSLLEEYWLHETRELVWWSQIKSELTQLTTQHRHLELLVNPYPDEDRNDHLCLLTRRDIVDKPKNGHTKGGRNFWTQLGGQFPTSFKGLVHLLNAQPQLTPWAVNQAIKGLVHDGYTQRYDKVLLLDMDGSAEIGCATEISYPMSNDLYIQAVEHMCDQIQSYSEYKQYLASPLSLRFVKASSQPLSMSYGRDSCFVEIVTLAGIRGYREIMYRLVQDGYRFDGRPHWGLNFDHLNLGIPLNKLYPKFNTWKRYYQQTEGVFSNVLTGQLGLDLPS